MSPRIISLIPSATEIVDCLGLTDFLIGRSLECDYPPQIQSLSICTEPKFNPEGSSQEIHDRVTDLLQSALSVYRVKTEVLEQLQPTHILTQAQCEVCAVSLGDVEQAVAALTQSQPQIISLQPNTIAEVWADIDRVACALGASAAKPLAAASAFPAPPASVPEAFARKLSRAAATVSEPCAKLATGTKPAAKMHDNTTAVPRRHTTRHGRTLEGNACMRCCKITRFADFQARQLPFPGFASARMPPVRLRLSAPIPRSFPSARPAATTGPRRSAHKLPIHPASSSKPAKTTRYAYTNHPLSRGNASAKIPAPNPDTSGT